MTQLNFEESFSMAFPALLLLLVVITTVVLATLVDSIPHLAVQVLLPPRWLLWVGVAALITWLSGGE
ncbi:MAG TPA: hypothetical protein V6D06_16800 [Trichocoleus sp.]